MACAEICLVTIQSVGDGVWRADVRSGVALAATLLGSWAWIRRAALLVGGTPFRGIWELRNRLEHGLTCGEGAGLYYDDRRGTWACGRRDSGQCGLCRLHGPVSAEQPSGVNLKGSG